MHITTRRRKHMQTYTDCVDTYTLKKELYNENFSDIDTPSFHELFYENTWFVLRKHMICITKFCITKTHVLIVHVRVLKDPSRWYSSLRQATCLALVFSDKLPVVSDKLPAYGWAGSCRGARAFCCLCRYIGCQNVI